MTRSSPAFPRPVRADERRVWLVYGGACLLAWLLYVLAGAEFQRGLWQLWEAVYQATLSLWPPMVLGILVYPWVRRLQRLEPSPATALALHALGALLFGALWQMGEFATAWILYGVEHARAVWAQTVLWRAIWGVLVYAAVATGFTAMLETRRARAAALSAAHAESALARAELAVITGKLDPHFLFNTLNSIVALTRKDAQAAEAALLRFAAMLRYVLDSKRRADDRVALADEVDFVRDYLALESLRLGTRLQVRWHLDPATLQDEVPPLSLQPLVENSVIHAIAPRPRGGTVSIHSHRDAENEGLALRIEDDGPGCDRAMLEGDRGGVGLAALKRRFALDYDGRARFQVHTAPGAGFRVEVWIPR